MAIVQKLNVGDCAQRIAFVENMLTIFEVNDDAIIMMSNEAHFHLNGEVNKQNYHYWPQKIFVTYTKDHCIALKLQFGVA